MKWIVPQILPEGVYLLAAAPKIGKSWLALQVGLAVAAGAEVLKQRVEPGRVLYLALEDGDRRLKSRLEKHDANFLPDDALARLWFETQWPRVNEDQGERLDSWLAAHTDARLVIIDVLERFRAPRSPKGSLYAEDYEAVRIVKGLAEKYKVAILIVHHTRKSEAADPLEMVSGTQGLAGGADGVLVLKRDRGSERAELHITGRDLEQEGAFAVEFNRATCRWELVGSLPEVTLTVERQAVLKALREASEPIKTSQVAAEIHKSVAATSNLLRKLTEEGLVRKAGYGHYELAPESDSLDLV